MERPIITVKQAWITQRLYSRFFRQWMLRYHKASIAAQSVALVIFIGLLAAALWVLRARLLEAAFPLTLVSFVLINNLFAPRYVRKRELYYADTDYDFGETCVYSRRMILGTLHSKVTPYEKFGSAIETKAAFFLFMPRRRVRYADKFDPDPYGANVILDKQALPPEQQQALRELFARKFGERFKGMK